ncbi:ras-specific guanine nucleotide-releasing factor 1-like [Rhopilema esculentum]|uniref:ras-specific guanine nucleotide-releasing factor 1-like n=1 Tax=Rhopilema esculentum TaxID=499914 RepID=UPI0031E19082
MRLNEDQFQVLALKARGRSARCGYLYKKSGKKQASDAQTVRLQKRYYVLYYNMMFYYEQEFSPKPIGVIMIEGCACRKIDDSKVFAFVIDSEIDDHRQYFFVASSEEEREGWMESIQEWSGEGLKYKNEELKTIVKGLEKQIRKEKESKERLQRECADQWSQVSRLKAEVSSLRDKKAVYGLNSSRNSSDSSRDSTSSSLGTPGTNATLCDDDLLLQYTAEDKKKIIQLQSWIRGWAARKRFTHIVEMYIMSPSGEKLMKRNRIIWQFVISEEDYVQQLTTLVMIFRKPLMMAADARYPACTVHEVRTLFSNCDVILMLHKMFLEGIKQRLKYWPNLKLEDFLSAMVSLLPIYHEYIRNYCGALQVLSECKRRPEFMKLLKWYERKPECNGQTIEQFLHYPVGLMPLYSRILGQVIDSTPDNDSTRVGLQELHDKVESLQGTLNQQMSECESIKHTLEIERTIDGGCDVLLDTDQKFIREGILRHFVTSKIGLGILREKTRHCFLFSRHLIITSRTADGNFRLAKICGKIPLKYTTLIEEVDDESIPQNNRGLAFTLLVHSKVECFFVTLMAARPTDKAIWTSDISQCIYNMTLEDPEDYYYDYENQEKKEPKEVVTEPTDDKDTAVVASTSLLMRTIPIKDDPRLVTDAEDIKYAERLESNSLPQILYASLNRLLERLVDPRLPGTDFMDTFLVTYRYFTTGKVVLQALIKFYHQLEEERTGQYKQLTNGDAKEPNNNTTERKKSLVRSFSSPGSRDRTSSILSTSSSVSSYDDYDTLSPITANDVINFTTLTRRHSREQWRENPLTGSSDDKRQRSVSQESGSVSDKSDFDYQDRRKTSPASFHNIGYQGTLNRLKQSPLERPVSAMDPLPETESPKSDSNKENLSRAASEQSVNSVCSDEVSDRQLETLMECSNEGSQTGSYREGVLDDFASEGDLTSLQNDVAHERGVGVGENGASHERGIDVEDANTPTVNNAKTLHLDYKQRLLVNKHLQTHRPSLPAILPVGSYDKDISKFLGMYDSQTVHAARKKGKKNKRESKMSRSPSTSSSNESQTEDRKSMFYDTEEHIEEKPPTPKSMKKTLKAALNSRSKTKSESQPESPKRKIFSFSRNKSHKTTGMRRSKSDMLHPSIGGFEDGEISRKTSTVDRRSFLMDDDTQSLYSMASYEDLNIKENLKESHSDNSLKDKASPKTKKGKNVTLRLYKNAKDDEIKPRAGSQNFHRDEGRVSMRAILPNRAPLKILNIMKHWVSKHNQDFEKDSELEDILKEFFNDVKENPDSLPVVKEIVKSMERLMETHRQAVPNSIEEVLQSEEPVNIVVSEFPPNWTASRIANCLSLVEHHLYSKISTREFMKCTWTKKDKETTAPYITKISRRFNQVSGMVATEVINGETLELRAQRIGFWITVAARCRDLNNFNSVLQITSGLMKSSVYRLKRSWELVNRQLKEILNDLQNLVSADNCFAKLRETIHNCNPPCVPFIGFYLTDLLYMDERSKNTNEAGLINYGKMSKIARAIREIRQYQQLRYTLDFEKDMALYLLATHVDVDHEDFEDDLYEKSLLAEPRG